MIAVLVVLALGQSSCPDSTALIAAASERAAMLDLRGAAVTLAGDFSTCRETAVAYWYVHGLVAARDAYRYGGSPESLELVRLAIAQLASQSPQTPASEVARFVLMAASSAAQSERDEMALILEHALDLERQQRSAGLPGAPIVAASEAAGDLWLQVHRFEDARGAYLNALEQVGATRRVMLGLARSASRLGDLAASCEQYRAFVRGWPRSERELPELVEARTFLQRRECRTGLPQPPRP